MTAATVKWVGEGSWTLDNLCFDWDHEAYQVWTCTVLHCTVLHCTVLHCTVLYCTVLYCTVLYQVWTCANTEGATLAKGESLQLTCSESSNFRCIGFLSI